MLSRPFERRRAAGGCAWEASDVTGIVTGSAHPRLVPALALALIGLALAAGPTAADECHRLDMEVYCAVSAPMTLVGDPFTATGTVKNTGDLPLANVTLAIRGGPGVQLVSSEPTSITIEKLDPGETREIRATFVSDGVGERRIDASARESKGWASAGCFCGVTVKGLPALQVEMIDLNDKRQPEGVFEMGQQFIYTLVVENDRGTAITPDLKVVWTLPPELEFVSGAGDQGVTVTGSGQQAESSAFVLAPDQKQNFELMVKVIGVPERSLIQTRASVVSIGGQELATETESTTLRPAVR
jgi:uncharacterized repeat protein (TIGR01451 family)